MKKKNIRKKLKAVDTRSAQVKCEEMFGILHIDRDIGNSAINALSEEMQKSQKPMAALADRAIEYFKDKIDDRHISILLAVFSLIFSRILFDPNIATITMTEIKKGDEKSGQTSSKEASRRIIIP